MEIIGYLSSIIIGVSLGLIGGGGSILTVPVLVYLFGTEPVLATAYSLFIVGLTSAVGSVDYLKKGLVNIKTAIIFGIPSIIAVFATRAYIVPAIPKEIFSVGGFVCDEKYFFADFVCLAHDRRILQHDQERQAKTKGIRRAAKI
jgi:uncharacterized membrane protein YfcA